MQAVPPSLWCSRMWRRPMSALGFSGCDRCADCGEEDDYEDDYEDDVICCERCGGEGLDPWNDYLLPCPLCQGEQRP